MKILAFDTSATVATVALCDNERLLAEYTVNNGNTHSETLLPMIESLLGHFSMSVSDVDLFAVSAGPGSFTGVRIGAATLKGLAFASDKPCVGVSTLQAIAENLSVCKGLICPVMNARRGQLYNALFRYENGALVRLVADRAISARELGEELSSRGVPFVLCGDGIAEFERLAGITPPCTLSPLLTDQNAVSVARVAYRRYLAGERGTDAALCPVYLRLPQAERERLEKLQAKESAQ